MRMGQDEELPSLVEELLTIDDFLVRDSHFFKDVALGMMIILHWMAPILMSM